MPDLHKTEDDGELVGRAQSGETGAFDQLVLKYTPKLYALVFNMTANHEDTNDLLQDIFARAYRKLRRFQGRSSFYTWIYAISVNMTLNFLKKRNKDRKKMSYDDRLINVEENRELQEANPSSNPVRQVEIRELNESLSRALQQLSNDHRAVVTMFDIMGLSHNEIAEIMGVSGGTVRSRLFYAHRQMQNYLVEFRR
jgi:RNA polymerase sigma factor (sigma-70 family)